MIRQLIQQTWFVCLMVFAIGWSGVSVAFNPMINMHQPAVSSSELLNHHASTSTHISNDATSAHCEKIHHTVQVKQTIPNECHQNISVHQPVDCQECSVMGCQSISAYLNAEVIPSRFLSHHQHIMTHYPHLKSAYLDGYWSEILRPPKASS